MDTHQLPALNAMLNTTSALFLVAGFIFIKRGQRQAHRLCMLGAVTASILFLISYLYYHSQVGSTRFQSTGLIRAVYFTVLTTHTILAAALPFLVGVTLWRAAKGQFDRHRRLARWTWPVWMYVSITGVAIYYLLYHLDGV